MPAELDARGLKCPLPVLRARKALQDVAAGSALRVLTTDPAAPRDFENFCEQAGHGFEGAASDGEGGHAITIRKKA
jgi:tRNA 2-thiouridine synthesizing protein A